MTWVRSVVRLGSRAGRLDRGEGDLDAGVEPFDLADSGAGLAYGVLGVVVAGAEVGEAGGAGADEDAGDLADGPGARDDAFLLAAASGYAPVLLAEAGVGPGRGHDALADRAAQVRVALAGAAGPGAVAGLEGARGQAGPRGGVPGVGNTDMSVPSSAMRTWALRAPTPVISSRRSTRPRTAVSLLAQPGACPPPASPHAVQAGATPGMDAGCCSLAAARRVVSSLSASMGRRCGGLGAPWSAPRRPLHRVATACG